MISTCLAHSHPFSHPRVFFFFFFFFIKKATHHIPHDTPQSSTCTAPRTPHRTRILPSVSIASQHRSAPTTLFCPADHAGKCSGSREEQDARTVPEGQGCEAGTGEFGDGGEVEAAEGGGEGVEEEGGEGEGEGWEEGGWHCGSWSGWSDWGGEAGWVADGWG